jgi:hypothetical protein
MKSVFVHSALAAIALLAAGCASVAETSDSTSSGTRCKIVMSQPARLNYDPARATEADRAAARGKLAAIELNQPPLRSATGYHANIEQALRDCP